MSTYDGTFKTSSAAISASWQRCENSSLDQNEAAFRETFTGQALQDLIARNKTFLNYAAATVDNTFELAMQTGSAVALSEKTGVTLYSRSDPDLIDEYGEAAFRPGTCWREQVEGTNAIGTCLIEGSSIAVQPHEHYLVRNRHYSGCASPIFSFNGDVLGTLAILSTNESLQPHTLGFVRTAAVLAETRIFVHDLADQIIIFFHSAPEHIGTIKQYIAAFNEEGRLVGANTAARHYWNLDSCGFGELSFHSFFSCSFQQLLAQVDKGDLTPVDIHLKNGGMVRARVSQKPFKSRTADQNTTSFEIHAPKILTPRNPPTKASDVLLDDLDTGDLTMRRALARASKILGHDIPLLIEGESGVGKEIFTRAFHNSGPRRDHPFVAVNCAAIPEGLIESELFGYEDGAFTGAKRHGYTGKVLQANKGTLFLDEIGDMPLALQGRLLRVLQERQVTPLGSPRSIPLDVSIVCATHRNIRDEIAAGRFRTDLYYRLNGLKIVLPALRERMDLMQLAHALLRAESGGEHIEISEDVASIFLQAEWPGNIRQLQMLLRIALALAGDGDTITREHLPDEFLEDLHGLSSNNGELISSTGPREHETGQLKRIERLAINRALEKSNGNVSQAARILGISRKTIYRRLEEINSSDSQ